MKYQLAIFDMDGTILNTLEDLKNATNYALRLHGYPERTLDEIRRFVGNGLLMLIRRAVPEGCTEEQIQKVSVSFHEYYQVHCADTTKPYDGILSLIRNLRAHGVKTAVVSNKPDYGVQELTAKYFPDCFDAAVGEREGIRKKPAPDSVNEVLMRLQIDRTNAIYIGDSDVDLDTAKNAGMPCISVEWGFRSHDFLLQHGAITLVTEPEQILNLILSI